MDLKSIDNLEIKVGSHEGSRGAWIQTYSGGAFFPLDPRPSEVTIRDIAHALSNQCRFTGHLKRFYSIAEHCCRVSDLSNPEDALWGLLHDASEAYVVDVPRPIKRTGEMAPYRRIEFHVMRAICQHFHLQHEEPESVKYADKVLLAVEARDLLGPLLPGWEVWDTFLPASRGLSLIKDGGWPPRVAEINFLCKFYKFCPDWED